MALTPEQRRALDEDGYLVIPDVLSATQITAVLEEAGRALADAKAVHAPKSASGTLHVDLEGAALAPVRNNPTLRAAVTYLLGEDTTLSRIAFRSPQPGYGAQVLHGDATLAAANRGVLRDVATAIVALVDFTAENGATRVVPGSHRTWALTVPREPDIALRGERIVTCRAGSAVVFAEALVHSGTRNATGAPRDSLQVTWNRVPS